MLEIEVQGARQIKEKRPDCVSIFVLPPSLEELEKRLRYRNTEDEETIQKRLAVARQEMETARDYDYVIVNDTIEHTVEQINKIITAEKLKVSRAQSKKERVDVYKRQAVRLLFCSRFAFMCQSDIKLLRNRILHE